MVARFALWQSTHAFIVTGASWTPCMTAPWQLWQAVLAARCRAWLKKTKSASLCARTAGNGFESPGMAASLRINGLSFFTSRWHAMHFETVGKPARSPVAAVKWQ